MKSKISLLNIINIFAFILFIVFLSYIVLDLRSIFNSLEDVERTKIEEFVKSKNSVIAPLINYEFYDTALAEVKKLDKNIKYIKINAKKFHYEKGNKKGLKIINLPLTYKNKKIGEVTVGYSDKELLDKFSQRYTRKVFIYLLIISIIFLVTYFYLKNKISNLNLLAKKIEKINFRKTQNIQLLDNYYEIINITNSINNLLNQINYFYLQQKKLIRKIIYFKKQLETAQRIADMFTCEYECEKNKFSSQNFYMKSKLNFRNLDEFINSISNKENFFTEIKKACSENYEFETIIKVINKQNFEFYFKIQGKSFLRDKKKKVVCLFIDITDEVKKQEKIEYLAYHDPLTGLINRTYLKEQLKTFLNLAIRNNKKLGIIFIDLDNFKYINDTFGHNVGDMLLVEISNRLQNFIRKSDILSRIGGDEFVLVLNNINKKEDIKEIMDKIKKILNEPVIIKGHKLDITFSAGAAIFPDDAENINDLLKYADIAMYESKKQGKNRFSFITENLKKEIKEYYIIIEDLKKALKNNNELVLYFQPKVDINIKKVVGVEGLIRWNHPKRGLLSPYYFINAAEKANLIEYIDDYVLEKGIQTLKKWESNEYLKNLDLAINISANKFNEPNFIKKLKSLIDAYKINPEKLQIEITETISMRNIYHTIEVLNEIKSLGVKVALDDFGTGYSSLNYLKKIPFDVLKIDQTFVKDLLEDKDDLVITKMIVEISKILNKINVAEGVENKKILDIISDLGVSIIQGYYFSKPLSEEELKKYIINFDYKNYV